MLENTQTTTPSLEDVISKRLEDTTDFTLGEHYAERIKFHEMMLEHYINEYYAEVG